MSGETKILQDSLHKVVLENSSVQSNLGEIIIICTEDKIELCLMNYLEDLGKKNSWKTPLGLLMAVILTFLTTNFKEWLLTKETWQAIFVIAGVIFFLWLLITIKNAGKAKTVKEVLEEIKKSSIKFNQDENADDDSTQHNKPDSIEIKNILSIIKAEYKTDNNSIDVTDILNNLVGDNKLNTTASNNIFSDPDKGTAKKLHIKYSYNGETIIKEFDENEIIKLP